MSTESFNDVLNSVVYYCDNVNCEKDDPCDDCLLTAEDLIRDQEDRD